MADFSENAFCSLCGVLVEPHDGSPIDEEHTLPWNSLARAVRTQQLYHNPYVTGVGYLNFHREVIADPRTDVAHTSSDVDLQAHELGHGPRRYWCFPVHEICWQLLCYRVDSGKHTISSDTIARHLFAILYNTPTDGSRLLLPGHDYGGAAEFQGPSRGLLVSGIYNSELFYIHHDPDDGFDFDLAWNGEIEHPRGSTCCTEHWEVQPDIPKESREVSSDNEAVPDYTNEASSTNEFESDTSKDIFQVLPSEIITLILCHLPTDSIVNLRLASPFAAAASRPSPDLLTQTFWSSRFSTNHEMAFAFAGRDYILPAEPIDWRQLYVATKKMLRVSSTYPGFHNRRRIWRTLDHILSALRLRIKNADRIAESPYEDELSVSSFDRSSIASGELTLKYPKSSLRNNAADTELDAGCRLFEKQHLNWTTAGTEKSVVLGASFLRHDQRTYISGLRLLSKWEGYERREFDRVGLIDPENEQLITLDTSHKLKTVRVRVVAQGIIGFCLILQDADSAYYHEIGDLGHANSESGIAELDSGAELRSCTFIFGLDACKLVSLQLTRLHPKVLTNIQFLAKPKQREALSDDSAEIWTPASPKQSLSWHSPRPSPPQSFNRCLQIDLNGSRGAVAQPLVMLKAFMGQHPHVFLGFSLIYGDGSERLFGRKSYSTRKVRNYPCVVQSFSIAGQRGEVLQEVRTSYSTNHDCIQAICFRTNFNRSKEFRLYGTGTYEASEINSITAPQGQSLSKLFVKLKSPGGHIRDLVAVPNMGHALGERVTAENLDTFSTPPLHLDYAKELLEYSGGFAFNTVELAGLRQVHFSSGDVGLSRNAGHLAGLQLQYDDDDHSSIVGQWFRKLETMELEPGERLVEIATWHGIVNRFSRVKFGPLTKMELVTSSGRRTSYSIQQQLDESVCLRYRENRYEELSAIVWACNFQWDHLRVVCKPKPGKRSKMLVLSPTTREIPQWTVREKIFLEEQDEDGRPDPLECITVTFKSLSDEPSGLSFVYRSGKQHTIGREGERPRNQPLQEDEKLTRMDIGVLRANRLGSIAFRTDKGRELTFMHENQRVRSTNMVQKVEIHLLQRDRSDTHERTKPHAFSVPDATDAFVGLWAIPARKDGTLKYPMFGPIFEADISG